MKNLINDLKTKKNLFKSKSDAQLFRKKYPDEIIANDIDTLIDSYDNKFKKNLKDNAIENLRMALYPHGSDQLETNLENLKAVKIKTKSHKLFSDHDKYELQSTF